MKRGKSAEGAGDAAVAACGDVIATADNLSRLTGIPVDILEKAPLLPSHQGCTRSTLCTIQAMNQLEVLMGSDWLGDHQPDVDRTMHLNADTIDSLVTSIKAAVNTVKRRFYMTERKAWSTLRQHNWDIESISKVVKLNKSYPLADHPQVRQIYMSFFGTDELCTMRRSNNAISTAVDHFIEEQCVEHVTFLMRDYLDKGEKKSSGSSGSGAVSGPSKFSMSTATRYYTDRLPALNTAVPPEGTGLAPGTTEMRKDWVVTLESPSGETETIKADEDDGGEDGIGKKKARRKRRQRHPRMAQHAPHYVMVYDASCKQVLLRSKPAVGVDALLYYTKDKPGAKPMPVGGGGFGGFGGGGRGGARNCAFCSQALVDEYYWVNSNVNQNPNFNMCMSCCEDLLQFQGVTLIYEAEKKLSATMKADELEEAQLLRAQKRAAREAEGHVDPLDEKKEPTVDYDTGVRYLKHLHSIREFHMNFLVELFRRLGLDDTPLRVPILHNPDGTLERITDQDFLRSSPWLQPKAMNLVVFKLPWKAAEGKDYFYLRFRNVLFEQCNAEVVAVNQQLIQQAGTPAALQQGTTPPVLPVPWGATTLLVLPNWIDQIDRAVFSNIYGIVTNPTSAQTAAAPQYQEDPTFSLGKHVRIIQLPNSPTVIHTVSDRADPTALAANQQQLATVGIDDLKIGYSCLSMSYISSQCPVTIDLSALTGGGLGKVDLSHLDQFMLPGKEEMIVSAFEESPFAAAWALQLFQYSQDWYTLSTQFQSQLMTYGQGPNAATRLHLESALEASSSSLSKDLLAVFPNYLSPLWTDRSALVNKNLSMMAASITKIPKFGFLGDRHFRTLDLGAAMPALMIIEDGFLMMAAQLTTIVLSGGNLTTIGNGVFSGCKNLVSIDCSEATNLSKIGLNFARDCSSLRRFSFPTHGEKLKKIGAGFLCGCPALRRVDFTTVRNVSPIGFWCVSLQTKQKIYTQQQIQQGMFVDPLLDNDFSKFMQGSAAMPVLDISCLETSEFDLSYSESYLVDPSQVFRGRHGGRGAGKRKTQYVDWEARLKKQGTVLRFSKGQEKSILKLREKAGSHDGRVEWEAPAQRARSRAQPGFGAAASSGFGGGGFGDEYDYSGSEYYEDEEEFY